MNRSQTIAAAAFGMGPFLTLRRIILPQAMRAILPGDGQRQSISMIKGTSIASVIFVNELTFRSQQIVGPELQVLHGFAAAGMIYLVMTSAVAVVQRRLEAVVSIPEIEPAPQRMLRLSVPRRSGSAEAECRSWPPR